MRRVTIGAQHHARRQGSAATDERPTVEGSRVRLLGKLCDGPEGLVVGIGPAAPGELPAVRLVHFAGRAVPELVPLALLRRLP